MDKKGEVIHASSYHTTKEIAYYIFVLLVSLSFWAWVIYALLKRSGPLLPAADKGDPFEQVYSYITTPETIVWFFLFTIFSHFLAIGYIRMNAVKAGPKQFPELWEAKERLAKKLNMERRPDLFVMTGHGILNAFAAKLVFRSIIVFYSDLAEALIEEKDQNQLEAVLAHELGHHALGHTRFFEWFLWPGEFIPFVGLPLSRARESSSDRIMKALIKDNAPCERALVKLAAGKQFGKQVDIPAFVAQIEEEKGFFAWLSEMLSTHPHLPKRIAAIQRFHP